MAEDAESELLQTLFSECTQLRGENHRLRRELLEVSINYEALGHDAGGYDNSRATESRETVETSNNSIHEKTPRDSKKPVKDDSALAMQLESTQEALGNKNTECRSLLSEIHKLKTEIEEQKVINANNAIEIDKYEKKTEKITRQLSEIKSHQQKRQSAAAAASSSSSSAEGGGGGGGGGGGASGMGDGVEGGTHSHQNASQLESTLRQRNMDLTEKLTEAKSTVERQRKQIADFSTESARRHSQLQIELQGMESHFEEMKLGFEVFMKKTLNDQQAMRERLEREITRLRDELSLTKREHLEHHRCLMIDHQCVLNSMQSMFDEYRKASEFMHSAELGKLQEEVMNQQLRYDHLIKCIIQAKEKFYTTMMVNKDANIMSLIEGSDLTTLLDKHEAELEDLRREHALEMQQHKIQQESIQEQTISMLKRHNATLEQKTEKMSLRIRLLEAQLREMTSVAESRGEQLRLREERILASDVAHAQALVSERERYRAVFQEKENMRHRIIRMKMENRGNGKQTVESLLARATKEATDLVRTHNELSIAHEMLTAETESLRRALAERTRRAEHLSSEVQKRSTEYAAMVTVFERFLSKELASKKAERARKRTLASCDFSSHRTGASAPPVSTSPDSSLQIDERRKSLLLVSSENPACFSSLSRVQKQMLKNSPRFLVPTVDLERGRLRQKQIEDTERTDMEQARSHLNRFKMVSKAFLVKKNSANVGLISNDFGNGEEGFSPEAQANILGKDNHSDKSNVTNSTLLGSKNTERQLKSNPIYKGHEPMYENDQTFGSADPHLDAMPLSCNSPASNRGSSPRATAARGLAKTPDSDITVYRPASVVKAQPDCEKIGLPGITVPSIGAFKGGVLLKNKKKTSMREKSPPR